MAWRRPGEKLLYERLMVSFLTHRGVTRLQRVNKHVFHDGEFYVCVLRKYRETTEMANIFEANVLHFL